MVIQKNSREIYQKFWETLHRLFYEKKYRSSAQNFVVTGIANKSFLKIEKQSPKEKQTPIRCVDLHQLSFEFIRKNQIGTNTSHGVSVSKN